MKLSHAIASVNQTQMILLKYVTFLFKACQIMKCPCMTSANQTDMYLPVATKSAKAYLNKSVWCLTHGMCSY